MEIVRKKLDASALYDPRLSYNVSEDMVYWDELEADNLDPRYTGSVPLPPDINLTCNQAATITALLRLLTEQTISSIEAGATAGQISAVILAILVVLGWVALFIAIIAALVAAAITAGAEALNDAFDESTWSTLQCILFCHLDENGFLSASALSLVIADVNDQLPVLASAILGYYFSALGNAGLNNASVVLGGLEEGDCDGCECEWCYTWTASQLETSGEFTHSSDETYSQFWASTFSADLIAVEFGWTWNSADGGSGSATAAWGSPGTSNLLQLNDPLSTAPEPFLWEGINTVTGLQFGLTGATTTGGAVVAITYLLLRGTGSRPAWTGGAEC